MFAIASLSDPEEKIRLDAISAIREVCQASRSAPAVAAPALADRLRDRSKPVRLDAAAELGRIGRAASMAADRLAASLDDLDDHVQIRAALALGKIRDARAVPRLTRGLHDVRWGPDRAESLGRIGAEAVEAVPALMSIYDRFLTGILNYSSTVAIKSVIALGRIGPRAKVAIPGLATRPPDLGEMRDAWVIAVRSFGPLAFDALGVLRRMANDPAHRLRVHVAVAIWSITREAEGPIAILSKLIDDHPGIASKAIEALGEIGPQAGPTLPAILNRLTSAPDPNGWTRWEGARAAWRIGRRSDIALPTCLAGLPRLSALGRARSRIIVQTLGEMGPNAREALPRLRDCRADDARLSTSGDPDELIEEDEAFLDDLDRAIASIEGHGQG